MINKAIELIKDLYNTEDGGCGGIEKKDAQVLSISGDKASCMDMETYETIELDINEDIKDVKEGDVILYWQIIDDKVPKQIKPANN